MITLALSKGRIFEDTLPLLRAYRALHGKPLAVIHFDAHCDTWSDHFGEPSGHGTWVYEAIQEGLVVRECFTQLGIRSAGVRAARDYVRDQGGQIFTARDLRGLDSPAQLAPVLNAIRTRLAAHGHPPVYLSLDIDCLDPAFAPGTGTPEPPLSKATDWVRYSDTATRELNTMPQWAGSCWYYLRFIDPKNTRQLVDPAKEQYWMPVDLYIGGSEHAVLCGAMSWVSERNLVAAISNAGGFGVIACGAMTPDLLDEGAARRVLAERLAGGADNVWAKSVELIVCPWLP